MSWGSWVLILVYAVLLASALMRLPESWPWLGRRVPVVARASDALARAPGASCARSAGRTSCSASALGIYTGILLNTMVARPLWNSAILGPLFLVSGLSAGAALMHIASVFLPGRPAPQGMVGGALAALCQPLGRQRRPRGAPSTR